METLREEKSTLQDTDAKPERSKGRRSIMPPAVMNDRSSISGSSEDLMARRASVLAGSGISMGGAFKTLLLAKRMSKRFSISQGSRRKSSVSGSDYRAKPQIRLEPTYQLEPKLKFDAYKVKLLLQDLLNRRMEGYNYNPKTAAVITRALSEEVKARIKELGFDRYKLIATIFLMENDGQGQEVCSRFLWDSRLDSFTSFTYQNSKITCIGSVYGIYHE